MKTEDRIKAAFDEAESRELEDLLCGIETEADSERIRRTGRAVLEKTGFRGKSRGLRSIFQGNAAKALAAAAAVIMLVGAAFGTVACAKEAKVYGDAVAFFDENGLVRGTLTRKEIKAVFLDITTKSFTYDKTLGVILLSAGEISVPGCELDPHDAAPSGVSALWDSYTAVNAPLGDGEYLISGRGYSGEGLQLFENGIYYTSEVEYEGDSSAPKRSVLKKSAKNKLLWEAAFDGCVITSFKAFDGCIIVTGTRGADTRAICFAAKIDASGRIVCRQDYGMAFSSWNSLSIAENADGGYTVFGSVYDQQERTHSTGMFRISDELEELDQTTLPNIEGYFFSFAARFGTGYAVLMQPTWQHWEGSAGAAERQLIVFIDAAGNITDSVKLSMDETASILSVGPEDRCFMIRDMIEHDGQLCFSGYTVPLGDDGSMPNPNSRHAEIAGIIRSLYSSGLYADFSAADFTQLVRENYTAMLIEFDPLKAEPRAFYSEAGALGDSLYKSADGSLVWNAVSISSAHYSPATSAFSIIGRGSVCAYRFSGQDLVGILETGAKVPFLR